MSIKAREIEEEKQAMAEFGSSIAEQFRRYIGLHEKKNQNEKILND